MSTAARSWWGRSTTLLRLGVTCAAMVCLLSPSLLAGQATDAAAVANQRKARAALAATIQALGGPAWLNLRTMRGKVRGATFFQGAPTGATFSATETSEFPDKDRIDFAKQRVVQIFSGDNGWEITYKGKRELPQQEVNEFLRRKKHSVDAVLREWYGNPAAVLIDEGPSQVERHLAEKITLIDSANDTVTLELDAESHLPLRLSYAWRDPQFHDKNVDASEYTNYHRIGGIATPFAVTRTHNGEVVLEVYVLSVQYNIEVQQDLFDPDYAAAHLK
ncbi:MAG: hypothetical protein ACYCOR_15120 [Acidobacteriaceae bacterium]